MKDFFMNLGNKPMYKRLLKEPLTYVGGAVILAVLQIATFSTTGKGWGVTSTFAYWGAWVLKPLHIDISKWAWFANASAQKNLAGGFLNHGGSVRDVAIIMGALLAALLASQFKIKKIKSKKQVFAAILGGLMMGYGARLAGGCNIGALFTGITFFSLSGWVFAIFLFIGAFLGSKLLIKYFM